MTVVVGTAGHVDHGKTALLQALTGIDADRLPEEQRRGMTIDLGYAHMPLPDGAELDFVDVPGHDRLVGNMLVGAAEIDAVLLVVAADEGISAQTREHVGLLDALGIAAGVIALTKLDLLAPADPRREARPAEIRALLAGTTLAGSAMVGVSARSGEGLDELRTALGALRRRVEADSAAAGFGARLAVDRVFGVRGRGLVVTGTLRGGPIGRGDLLRVEPNGRTARVREIQVHNRSVDSAAGGGRIALNLAGVVREEMSRGVVLCSGPAVHATGRVLVALRLPDGARPVPNGSELRLHVGTDELLCRLRTVGPLTTDGLLAVLTVPRPVAAALDDRLVLRWPSPAQTAAGGWILDPQPPQRLVRRRSDPAAILALVVGGSTSARLGALLAAHGILAGDAIAAYAAALGIAPGTDLGLASGAVEAGGLLLDPALAAKVEEEVMRAVRAHRDAQQLSRGAPLTALRTLAASALRRTAAVGAHDAAAAADSIVARMETEGRLERDGDAVRDPGPRPDLPAATHLAMGRVVAALRTLTPPDLGTVSREAGCPPEGLRALEKAGRIVRLTPDLAYAAETFAGLEALAMRLAADGPITPAAFRDATGTSRKYALGVLEELDARGLLRRGPDGHGLGPRAPRVIPGRGAGP